MAFMKLFEVRTFETYAILTSFFFLVAKSPDPMRPVDDLDLKPMSPPVIETFCNET